MKLELKGIKYAAFASEETHCFNAKLYVDGKHVADVSNDGHGAANYVYWKDGAHVSEKQVNDWIKANIPPTVFHDMTIEANLEIWCGNAMNEHLAERDVERTFKSMKNKVLTIKDGKIYQFSWKGVKQIDQRHVDAIKQKYPDRIILNCLTASEAQQIIRQSIA